MRRVVITGAGAITPLGATYHSTCQALAQGRSAIGPLNIPDIDRLCVKIGAQIHDFTPTDHFERSKLALYDRTTQFALVAAREAMSHARLTLTSALALRAGVILGTSGGGLTTQDENYRAVYEQGKNRVHPFIVPKLMHNAPCSHIAIEHNIQGPSYTVSTACASSNHAIGQALHMVRSGLCDVMLTGGSESMLCFGGLKAWEGLRVMSQTGCRPFCKSRDGFVQGEGAAIYVIEAEEHARARGANILCELAGFSMNSDSYDILKPCTKSAARAMSGALRDAKLTPKDIGYINAHGTATRLNDITETRAIIEVFGQHAHELAISSTKSMHGHLIGAAGAVELMSCIMALTQGCIAPTIGYQYPDPECSLNITPNSAEQNKDVTAALSNAFAFGGLNAVLAFKRYVTTY